MHIHIDNLKSIEDKFVDINTNINNELEKVEALINGAILISDLIYSFISRKTEEIELNIAQAKIFRRLTNEHSTLKRYYKQIIEEINGEINNDVVVNKLQFYINWIDRTIDSPHDKFKLIVNENKDVEISKILKYYHWEYFRVIKDVFQKIKEDNSEEYIFPTKLYKDKNNVISVATVINNNNEVIVNKRYAGEHHDYSSESISIDEESINSVYENLNNDGFKELSEYKLYSIVVTLEEDELEMTKNKSMYMSSISDSLKIRRNGICSLLQKGKSNEIQIENIINVSEAEKIINNILPGVQIRYSK